MLWNIMFFFQSSKVVVTFFILFASTVSFCTLRPCNVCTVGAFVFLFVEPQLQPHFQHDCSSHAGRSTEHMFTTVEGSVTKVHREVSDGGGLVPDDGTAGISAVAWKCKRRWHELSTRQRRYSSHQLIYVASRAENRVITTPTSWTGVGKVTLFFIWLIRRQCFQRHFPNLDKVGSSQHCKPPAAVIIGSFQRPNNHSQMTGVSRKVSHLSGKEGS